MKQKTITTDKATLLVVELPEGGKRIAGIACDITGHFILWDDGGSYHDDNRPHGQFRIDDNPRNKWKLLGRLPDITDGDLYTLGFRADKLSSILDKLEHLIIKNNIYFKNIHGETKPLPPWQDLIESEGLHFNYKHRLKLWQEAQAKVWDRERTFLFIKVD